MKLRHFAITQQGQSHLASGDPCQDYSGSCRVVNENLGIEIACGAIADGVGSCVFSQDGSRVAVTTVLSMLSEALPKLTDVKPETLQALIRQAFEAALHAVEEEADARELPRPEFDATLTVAILLEDGACHWGHAGDDGIVALFCDGRYEMITTRHKGEARNFVHPLATRTVWSFGSTEKPVAALTMMTDGVLDQNVAYEDMENRVYLPFFAPVFKYVMENDEEEAELRQMMDDYLASPDSRDKISDDITFVLLQNTVLLPGVTPAPFDEEKFREDRRILRQQKNERLAHTTRKRQMEFLGMVPTEEDEYLQPAPDAEVPEAVAAVAVKADGQPAEGRAAWNESDTAAATGHGVAPAANGGEPSGSRYVQAGRIGGLPRPAHRMQPPASSGGIGGLFAKLFGFNKLAQQQSVWLKDGTELQYCTDAAMACGDAEIFPLLCEEPHALVKYSRKLVGPEADALTARRMQHHVEGLIRHAGAAGMPDSPAYLWPTRVAYDQQDRFVGFVIPFRVHMHPAQGLFSGGQQYRGVSETGVQNRARLALQLVEMVENLHRQGIFIGNLQPDSLMLENYSQLVMVRMDRLAKGVPVGYAPPDVNLRYLAPEMWRLEPWDMARMDLAAADAYSLAVMLFELFTGMRLQRDGGRRAAQSGFSTIFTTQDREYMRYRDLPLPRMLHLFFSRAFDVSQDDLDRRMKRVLSQRPTVDEWYELLTRMATGTRKSVRGEQQE